MKGVPLPAQRLRAALAARATDRVSGAVFIFDLDAFKKVNDTFGHSVGDELWAPVGQPLRQHLRIGDIIGPTIEGLRLQQKDNRHYRARIGGDAFPLMPIWKDTTAPLFLRST